MKEKITVTGGALEENELNHYLEYVQKKNPGRRLESLDIELDGEFVNLKYQFEPVPFDRIRRITGYLVGGTDRWNDAKLAELNDRVNHGTSN